MVLARSARKKGSYKKTSDWWRRSTYIINRDEPILASQFDPVFLPPAYACNCVIRTGVYRLGRYRSRRVKSEWGAHTTRGKIFTNKPGEMGESIDYTQTPLEASSSFLSALILHLILTHNCVPAPRSAFGHWADPRRCPGRCVRPRSDKGTTGESRANSQQKTSKTKRGNPLGLIDKDQVGEGLFFFSERQVGRQ